MASAPRATPSLRSPARSGGDEGGGGVEQDNVAACAFDAGEHVVEQSLIGFDIAAGEVGEGCARQTGHLRRYARAFERGFGAGFGFNDRGRLLTHLSL